MTALGLPDFGPVQANVAWNDAARHDPRACTPSRGTSWSRVASGRAYAAWVDLRGGPAFGATYAVDAGARRRGLRPRGVGNGYQTLADATTYTYLVNDHWRPDASYVAVDLADPALAIAWPMPLDERVDVREGPDRARRWRTSTPSPPRRPLVLGAGRPARPGAAGGLPGRRWASTWASST